MKRPVNYYVFIGSVPFWFLWAILFFTCVVVNHDFASIIALSFIIGIVCSVYVDLKLMQVIHDA